MIYEESVMIKKEHKLLALLILGVVVFLISKKLFISLFLLACGCFLLYTFGKNVHAKHPSVVMVGVLFGILFLIAGIVYWFL